MARRPRKKTNRYDRDPLYQPGRQLSGRRLRRAATQLVNLQFQPAERALGRESATATRQGTALIGRAGDYYGNLAREAQQHVTMQQAIGQRLAEALAGNLAQTRAGLPTGAVTSPGAGLDGGGAAMAQGEAQAQRARAELAAQTARNAAAAGTADYSHLADLSDRATAARGGEISQQLINRLANKQADIGARRSDLSSQRGDALTKQILGLRQSGFENMVTARSLGLKEADLAAGQQDKAADRNLKERIARINSLDKRRQQAITHGDRAAELRYKKERDAEMLELGVGPYRPAAGRARKPESASAVQLKTGITNATSDLTSDPKLRGASAEDQRRILSKRGAPPIVVRAALERAQYGGIRPSTAAELRRLGVRVPRGWLGAFSGPPTPR